MPTIPIMNAGRMLADGIPYPDFVDATQQIADTSEWYEFWAARAETYAALGDAALADRHPHSGGRWLWQGSLSAHYAQFMWFHDAHQREAGQRRKVELYNRAAPHFDPPAERVEIAFEGATIPGFLRLPAGARPRSGWPCALLIGGIESTKEESFLFENLCLARGLATFAFDGPGQGEMFFEVKLQPDFERYASAVVDELEQRDEIDATRLGVLGRSLGGFYAIRSAAREPRLRACVAWSFFYDLSDFDAMPVHTQAGLAYISGCETVEEGRKYVQEALTLRDVTESVSVPTLLLNGLKDHLFTPRQMERVSEALANAPVDVVLEPNGDHCCHNMAHIARPRLADWLAGALEAGCS
jgi:2,6-dihydroxypseudooxynicotine hydrolase